MPITVARFEEEDLLQGNKRGVFPWVIFSLVFISLLLATYSIIRAVNMELTIDELYSWEKYAQHFQAYLDDYGIWSANHHWLNSWLMHLSASIFGEHSLSLRLPNILAHIVYLYFTARIALLLSQQKYWDDFFAVVIFILLNAHPYLLDYFSLARGYGLSLGTMAGSVYFLFLFAREQRSKDLLLSIFWGALAVLSSFVLLNFFFVLVFVLFVLNFLGNAEKRKTNFIWLITLPVLLLLLVVPYILLLKQSNCLFFGKDSLWNETTNSLSWGLLYGASYAGSNSFSSSKLSIEILLTVIFLFNAINLRNVGWKTFFQTNSGLSFVLFIGTLVVMVVQHAILGTPYPPGRSSLFIFFCFLLALFFAIANVFQNARFPKIIFVSLLLPVLFHFFSCLNIEGVYEYRQASGTRKALDKVIADHSKTENSDTVTIITGNISGASMHYLAGKKNLPWLKIIFYASEEQPPHGDYYFVEASFLKPYDTSNWIALYTNDYAGNVLMEDKKFALAQLGKQ